MKTKSYDDTIPRFKFFGDRYWLTLEKVSENPTKYQVKNKIGASITASMNRMEALAWIRGFEAGYRSKKCSNEGAF